MESIDFDADVDPADAGELLADAPADAAVEFNGFCPVLLARSDGLMYSADKSLGLVRCGRHAAHKSDVECPVPTHL